MIGHLHRLSLLIVLFFFPITITSHPHCDCLTENNIKNSEDHLKLVTKITSLKMLPRIRDMIYQADREKYYLLERTRFDVINHLKSRYGMLITHTDFQQHFHQLIQKIEDIMHSTKMTTSDRNRHLTEYLHDFYSDILPSTFLCLTMGECVSALTSYTECMHHHSSKWHSYFGKEKISIAKSLANTIEHYQLIESRLMALQTLLIESESKLSSGCSRNYTRITNCESCIADRMGYCRTSCNQVSYDCFSELNTQFDQHIFALTRLNRLFDDGFNVIRRGLLNDLRRLVEVTSPDLARNVVGHCGTLPSEANGQFVATKASPMPNHAPKSVPRRLETMISQLNDYNGHWRIVAEGVCSDPSTENFCWNGTNIIRSVEADGHSIDEPSILKNVRPKPKMPDEGSASPWLDDEDFAGSGNGSGDEPIDDDMNAVVATVRPSGQLTSAVPTSPSFNHHGLTVTEAPGGSTTALGYLSSIIVLIVLHHLA